METKETLFHIDRIIYTMFIMLTIVIITFLSFLTTAKFFICPIILVIEYMFFLFIKRKEKQHKFEELEKNSEKLNKLKNILDKIFIVFSIIFVLIVVYAIYKTIIGNTLNFFIEIVNANIISFILFIIFLALMYVFTKKDKNIKIDTSNVKNLSLTKGLKYLVYGSFIIITCIIPFIYGYYTEKMIWVISSLSTLIFGVLISVILRIKYYNKSAYSILALSLLFVVLMSIFSQIESLILGYVLFLISIIISLFALKNFNKNSEISVIILTILLVLVVLSQILIK